MSETFPGTQILAAFGQTEMSPVTCMLLGDDAIRKLGSVGKVIPTVSARVVDDDMNDVPIGQVGEIVYRAPTLMEGYWNNPKATAEAFAGGWFHSGDLVRQDEEGYIWVVDRKKDMIISGGENIYCAEVENVLAGHPAIVEVAVIGRTHDKWGEVPVAVAAVTQPDLGIADLDEFLTRTACPVQASEASRGRRRPAAKPRWQSPENGTEKPVRGPRNRLTLTKVPLPQQFLQDGRKAELAEVGFANGYRLNPTDAVRPRASIVYIPVVRLTTHE